MAWSHRDDINRTDAVRVELNASMLLPYMCIYTAEENVMDDLMLNTVVLPGKCANVNQDLKIKWSIVWYISINQLH